MHQFVHFIVTVNVTICTLDMHNKCVSPIIVAGVVEQVLILQRVY